MITAGHACFDRLTVRDARTGRPPGSCSRADLVAEGAEGVLPRPTIARRQECPGGRLRLGQLLWKHPLRTAAAHHAEHGVADRSAAHRPGGQLAYSVWEIGVTASLPWSGTKRNLTPFRCFAECGDKISVQRACCSHRTSPSQPTRWVLNEAVLWSQQPRQSISPPERWSLGRGVFRIHPSLAKRVAISPRRRRAICR
jgi:hypothetical protein